MAAARQPFRGRAWAPALALLACTALPARGQTAAPDSLRWRFEAGAASDFSNERYYEDTSSVATRLVVRPIRVDDPESRSAAVWSLGLEGSRGEGRLAYHLRQDGSLGDRASRFTLEGLLRHAAPDWRVTLVPGAEYRRDRTFGRDLEQFRAGARARVRHSIAGGAGAAEIAGRVELLATSGAGSEFLPDRRSAGASLAFEHLDLLHDARLAIGTTTRSHPDSLLRDHFEHVAEAGGRWAFAVGHALLAELGGVLRIPRRPVPDTRDDFREARAALEWEGWTLAPAALRARLEGEWLRFDRPDSAVWFDLDLLRARAGVRAGGTTWGVAAGPRVEIARAPDAPAEDYDEWAGWLELEHLGDASWWSLMPAAGWREVRFEGGPAAGALQSSHAFVEATLLGDQPVGAGLRLRLSGTARVERHAERSEDAAGLYFSLDLRKIF